MTDLPLHILALQAENFAKIKALRITPDGRLVELTGKNANGKSSVLRLIWSALGGADSFPEVPIRVGETKAVGQLDIGDATGLKYRATLRFTLQDDGSFTHTLTVENADGARYNSPTTMMKNLLGSLTFDPLVFAEADSAEQLKMMRAFVPGVDFAAIDRANKTDFATRTDVNRRAKDLKAQAAGVIVPDDAPNALVDVEALVDKLTKASTFNSEIDQRQARRDELAQKIVVWRQEAVDGRALAVDLRRQADEAEAEAKASEDEANAQQKRLDEAEALPEKADAEALQAEISRATVSNAIFERVQRKADLEAQAKAAEDESEALTKAMDDRKADVAKKVKAAGLPVEGITLDDDKVLLDGLPLSVASDAQRLVVSLKICAAMNPKLRVATVTGGEKLDEDALALLAKTAQDLDLQIWMERVDNTGKVGFVLQDGEVKDQPPFERLIKPEKPKKGAPATEGQGGE